MLEKRKRKSFLYINCFAFRKIDQQPSDEYGNHKLILGESKSEGKLKKSAKKNVNFKELRTIYRKDLDFKNSDTDSNYISKTSTTVPSNGSIVDNKSNDSAKEGGKVLRAYIPSP